MFGLAEPRRAGADVDLDATALVVEVEGDLDHAFDTVKNVLLDLEAFARWFPAIDDWRVLSTTTDSALVYGRQNVPWPARDRDYVVEYRWGTPSDGSFFLEAVSRVGAEPAPPPGVDRVEDMTTRWTALRRGQGPHVRYAVRGTPRIPLPRRAVELFWAAHGNRVIHALSAEIVAVRSERD